ncbi:Hypersensitive-induced response protein 3 [Tetrabaena socialis]|uniref:Hypersensitive-induced response protein 3 n=1 Tax=Tetrabaena socialis TaxID=47790 RepID=A0A2J8A6K4_9CHLO|nr:Hypersensitive-induced response protein 3 [Tetrabaena socialis]|eukprot:PNH08135.1 Hypersensitive-induced response protein 3 [Tetrabaena socialis]
MPDAAAFRRRIGPIGPICCNTCLCLCCCFTCPEQETVVVLEQCGKFSKVAQPGFNCVNCCCGETVAGSLSLRVQQLDIRCETKSKDNVFVTLMISVQYQVVREAIYDAYYKLTDSRQQISAYVFDEVRAAVPKLALDDAYELKDEIAKSIKDELTKSMAGYGYFILHVLVNDIEPAHKVKEAMNEINAARRLRIAAAETAEAHKVAVVKAAEAEAEAKFLQGQGIARQRQAIVNGLRDTVQDFQNGVQGMSSREVLSLMLITQYFDTLKDLGAHGKSSTVFLNHNPAGVSEIAAQIRGSFMEATAANIGN